MWLISCATTPCNSSRLNFSRSPLVTATIECSGERPVANAFSACEGITYTSGVGVPAAIAISSTTLQS